MMKLHKTIAYMLGFAGLVLVNTASAAVIPAMTNSPYLPGTLTSTSVTVTGYYNNSPTSVYFEYGTTAWFGAQTPALAIGNVTGPMSVTISGLTPNTTYYYRSVGVNSAGTGYGSPTRTFTTTAAVQAPATPSITSIYATNITQTSATLYGAVNANGASGVTATITYNGNTVISQAVTGTSSTAIQYTLGGLTAGASYSFSVCATGISCQTVNFNTLSSNANNNGNGTGYYTAPSVTTYSASNVTNSNATLNGYIAPNSSTYVNRYFQYGTNQYSLVMSTQSAYISSTSSVSDSVYNLQPNTTYYFRAVAQDSGNNLIYGSILSFYTGNNNGNNGNGQATATTYSATNVTNSNATLNGYIVSNGASVNRYFQYGTSASLASSATTPSTYFGNTSGNVSNTVNNLQPNTTYYFRLVTQDSSSYSLSYGSIISFSTGTGSTGTTLSAITTDATFPTVSSLKLNGLAVNNSGYSATAHFEYGTSAFALTKSTAIQNIGTTSSTSFSDTLYGLATDGAIYYRAVVQNSNGLTTRGDVLFGKTTANSSVVTTVVDTTTPTNATSGARVRNAYIELGINTPSETVAIGNTVDYTLFYKNITTAKTIKNVVVRVILPKAVKLNTTSAGKINESDNTVTIDVGTLVPGQEATVSMQGSITNNAKAGDLIVTTTSIVYTDAITGNQGDAIAYISNRVTDNNNNLLGAALFGAGFFPSTFIGWLILIMLIMGLVYFARKFYRQNEAHHPGHVEKAAAHN
jgi:hypothetical protein